MFDGELCHKPHIKFYDFLRFYEFLFETWAYAIMHVGFW